jgi:hypothetical protein
MNNGSLIQHMSHPGSHDVKLAFSDKNIKVTSTHHQMQNPSNLNKDSYLILGESVTKSPFLYTGDNTDLRDVVKKDSEIVLYQSRYTKDLAIQGHPEMSHATKEFQELALNLIKMLIVDSKRLDLVQEVLKDDKIIYNNPYLRKLDESFYAAIRQNLRFDNEMLDNILGDQEEILHDKIEDVNEEEVPVPVAAPIALNIRKRRVNNNF